MLVDFHLINFCQIYVDYEYAVSLNTLKHSLAAVDNFESDENSLFGRHQGANLKPADDSSNEKLKFSTKKTRKKRSLVNNLKAKLILTLPLYGQTLDFNLQMTTTNNFTSARCFFTGLVNKDKHSHVFINLCQQELVVNYIYFFVDWYISSKCYDLFKFGSFRFNKTDYFIEPHEEFNSKPSAQQTEFSYVLIDHQIVTLKPHVIFNKSLDTYDTCALLGN